LEADFINPKKKKNFLKSLGISKFTSKGTSLKVPDISSAKAEIYFTTTNKIKQWDTCASNCIIAEAGVVDIILQLDFLKRWYQSIR